jgi:hypothetical protein
VKEKVVEQNNPSELSVTLSRRYSLHTIRIWKIAASLVLNLDVWHIPFPRAISKTTTITTHTTTTTINKATTTMSSSSARPRPSMMASVTHEWLWCDDHTKITQWFLAQPRLTYKEFYASFINVANKAWELSRRKERAPLEGVQKFIVELLQQERVPADELLTDLQEYSAGLGEGRSRWKENGLVNFRNGLSKSFPLCPPSTVLSYGDARPCPELELYPQRAALVTPLCGHCIVS